MIEIADARESPAEWTALVARAASANLLQAWEYGEAKAATTSWRPRRLQVRKGREVVGVVQAMARPLPVGGRFVFVNRGPLFFDPSMQAEATADAVEALGAFFEGEAPSYVRIATPVVSGGLSRAPRGFRPSAMTPWTSAALDLRPETRALRAGLQKRWRNALARAERLDSVVDIGCDAELFAELIEDYTELLRVRGFRSSITPVMLDRWRQAYASDGRFLTAIVRHGGRRVASGLFHRLGVRAEYLIGCFSDAGRTVGVGQLLLWQAIASLKAHGVEAFDVGGVSPDTPGIGAFKAGLNARPYTLVEPLDARPAGLRWRVVALALRARAGG